MGIHLNLLILCNILLILPCFSENNHKATNKIDEVINLNYSTTNSFASDLKKNFTSDILNKKLAEAENTTSKPSSIKARKKAELDESVISNATIVVSEKQQVYKNVNETISRPDISHENNSKIVENLQKDTIAKTELKNKNSTEVKITKLIAEKLPLTTNKTANVSKNVTKTNHQTVNLEGGSEISINNKIKNLDAKNVTQLNSTKLNTVSAPVTSLKSTTIATTIKPSKINVNNSTLNNTNSAKNINTKVIGISTTKSTSTTTTTTTTTTTPKPKKPKITYSQEDVPAIGLYAKKLEKNEHNKLTSSSAIEEPIVQPVKEDLHGNHRDYILPIVAFIFAVPILMGAAIISYRRIKDYWSTRHYRRMDFLVDGMYNE